MKGSLARHLTIQLGQASFMPLNEQQQLQQSSSFFLAETSRFQNLLEAEAEAQAAAAEPHLPSSFPLSIDAESNADDKDFILSQDFFCTPDYITPDVPPLPNHLDDNKENTPCPRSPEKLKSVRSKRQRLVAETAKDTFEIVDLKTEKTTESQGNQSYVSQSAVALRCRVMPPPCIKNPYLKHALEVDVDPFHNHRSKCAGFFPSAIGGDGLSRYRTDFHEIEQIGFGNFSRVFKVLKRIDGCMYAVKHIAKQLHQDMDSRQKALMEVQALAALGSHENIVSYYSSWFENEQLYIHMELCGHSLSIKKNSKLSTEEEVLEVMHQMAKALQFIHERGIAHLDVKPDNIYIKNGIYKLGDFGCATLLDRSLPIEEGDARYMPQEILNDKYDHLDKVDIFALGAAIYELVKGSPLPESGPHFLNLREGKLPLLPGHSVPFQNLLKAMMDPDPIRRPTAQELLENPIFARSQRTAKTK